MTKLHACIYTNFWPENEPMNFSLLRELHCWCRLQCLSFILFYNGIVPLRFHPWEIWVAFPGESQLWQSHSQPTVPAGCFVVSIIHWSPTRTTGSLTCTQMLMDAVAHMGVRTPWESLHWKLTLGEKSLVATGNHTCLSGMPVQHCTNWVTSPHHWMFMCCWDHDLQPSQKDKRTCMSITVSKVGQRLHSRKWPQAAGFN